MRCRTLDGVLAAHKVSLLCFFLWISFLDGIIVLVQIDAYIYQVESWQLFTSLMMWMKSRWIRLKNRSISWWRSVKSCWADYTPTRKRCTSSVTPRYGEYCSELCKIRWIFWLITLYLIKNKITLLRKIWKLWCSVAFRAFAVFTWIYTADKVFYSGD